MLLKHSFIDYVKRIKGVQVLDKELLFSYSSGSFSSKYNKRQVLAKNSVLSLPLLVSMVYKTYNILCQCKVSTLKKNEKETERC